MNRDEDPNRPTIFPHVLDEEFGIFGGKDVVHGGTWLAVNKYGLFAALTNYEYSDGTMPSPSGQLPLLSRGFLVLDILKSKTVEEMYSYARFINATSYKSFNLLFGSVDMQYVLHGRDAQTKSPQLITESFNLLCNGYLNCIEDTRTLSAKKQIGEWRPFHDKYFSHSGKTMMCLEEDLLTSDVCCKHDKDWKTVSSSAISINNDGYMLFLYAAGAPCVTEYKLVYRSEADYGKQSQKT